MGWLGAATLLAAAVLAVVCISGYREALRAPLVAHYHLALKDAPQGSPPLRIVLMTDTHAGWPDMSPQRLRGIVAQANALRPDLVLLGGDYLKGAPFGIGDVPPDEALAPLYALRARLGVIAVLGNNDCARGRGNLIARLLSRGGVRVPRNAAVLLPGVAVLGIDDVIHCKGNMGPAKLDFARQLKGLGRQSWPWPVILLSHEPVFAHYAPGYVDAALAGHTHGGQMFPALTGPIAAHNAMAPKARGKMLVGRLPLIISSGAGTNNLPLRIGVPPEIVLLTISPA